MVSHQSMWFGKISKKKLKMINIKTRDEIEIMKEGGKIAARILKILEKSVSPGINTLESDKIARDEIKKANAKASFLGHAGYPANICTSVNSQVVHGIPNKTILKEGDIVGIDLGIYFKGYHADTAATYAVGKASKDKMKLIKIAKESLYKAIKLIKPGIFLGDIQNEIQKVIEKNKYGIVKDLAGHGIGKELQEAPSISNYGKKGTGPVLKEGMVLAIEPMITDGDWHVNILTDGWTVETVDGSNAAHFEHTVVVTKNGYEILTKI